jgi:hypothetical protein
VQVEDRDVDRGRDHATSSLLWCLVRVDVGRA